MEVGDRAGELEMLVDGAGVAGALGADEAEIKGRELGVFEPGVEEEVAAAEAKGGEVGGEWGGEAVVHLVDQGGGGALVGVEQEDPGVAEGEGAEGEVALRGEVVEVALVEVSAVGAGDLRSAVGAEGVEDVDVVGPAEGGEAGGEIGLFVAGEDEHREHGGYGTSAVDA